VKIPQNGRNPSSVPIRSGHLLPGEKAGIALRAVAIKSHSPLHGERVDRGRRFRQPERAG
jgi:hypothetical protein